MTAAESCKKTIATLLAIDLIIGIISGYFNMKGESDSLLITLVIGIVFVAVTFYFVQKYGELKSGKKVDKY